ncbi:MAG: hypothetical protein ACE5EF_08920 [Dehalococcoidia bacterium]
MSPAKLVVHLALAAVGFSGGFGLALLGQQPARAASTANIYAGYVNKCDSWRYDNWNPWNLPVTQGHYCWHFDEAFPNQWHGAIDEHTNSGPGDANQNVIWLQTGSSWSDVVTDVLFEELSGSCTGVRVTLRGGLAGAFHYLHIDPAPGVDGSTWQNWTSWSGVIQGDRYLGKTSATQPGCPWGGPHLHQSGNVDWWTDIYRRHPPYVDCGGPLYCWSGPVFQVVR